MKHLRSFLSGAKELPKLWNLLSTNTAITVLNVLLVGLIILAMTGNQIQLLSGMSESTTHKLFAFVVLVICSMLYSMKKLGEKVEKDFPLLKLKTSNRGEYREKVVDFFKHISNDFKDNRLNNANKKVFLEMGKSTAKRIGFFLIYFILIFWAFNTLTDLSFVYSIILGLILLILWIKTATVGTFERSFDNYYSKVGNKE